MARPRSSYTGPLPTLGSHDSTTLILRAHCEACRHYAELDVAALIDRYGADIPAISLNGRFRCTRCGALGGVIQCVPRGTATYHYPR